jgi:hypothetical protein
MTKTKFSNESKYLNFTERFDADKLNHIIQHRDAYRKTMETMRNKVWPSDPFMIAEKYLNMSRRGHIEVTHVQNQGKGRFCARGSLSLQTLAREIRHTIARDYYVDIDMVNCHPVILSYLCAKQNFNCDNLNNYIADRESALTLFKDRDTGKKCYLSVINGGSKLYNDINIYAEEDNKPKALKDFKKEMTTIHNQFIQLNPDAYEKHSQYKTAKGENWNMEASYMNTLLCDFENKILMKMFEFFGSPKDAVPCADGIMLKVGKDYDLEGCCKYVEKELGIQIQLKLKEMNDVLPIKKDELKSYKEVRLEFFEDKENIQNQEVTEALVQEWVNNSMVYIENGGAPFFVTKNKKVKVFDNFTEVCHEFEQVKIDKLLQDHGSMAVKCLVLNPDFDVRVWNQFKDAKVQDIPLDFRGKAKKYKYEYLGKNKGKQQGYLVNVLEERALPCKNEIQFHPYLKSKGCPDLGNAFNLFAGFPFEDRSSSKGLKLNFEGSLLYKHILDDFCNGHQAECDHLLDWLADIIQDPSRIKQTSHLKY